MEKLPSTSYVRLVDIWLICGQLIPFIEVILVTLREVYNEEDVINHHGHARRVGSILEVGFLFLIHNTKVFVNPVCPVPGGWWAEEPTSLKIAHRS